MGNVLKSASRSGCSLEQGRNEPPNRGAGCGTVCGGHLGNRMYSGFVVNGIQISLYVGPSMDNIGPLLNT